MDVYVYSYYREQLFGPCAFLCEREKERVRVSAQNESLM